MFPAFVINLDRDVERAAAFAKRANECSLSVERVSGFDAAAHTGPYPRTILNSARYSAGAIGCALSHRALWEKCAASTPIIVFEDDVHIRRDFATAFPETLSKIKGFWDIILFGFNTDHVVNVLLDGVIETHMRFAPRYPSPAQLEAFAASSDPVSPVRLHIAFGTCGYAISPPGARKLLSGCFPMDDRLLTIGGLGAQQAASIDAMMSWHYPKIAAYVCLPPLVLPPNAPAASRTKT